MVGITPWLDNKSSCLEQIYVSLSKYKRKPFELIFSYSWDFYFDNNTCLPIEDRIGVGQKSGWRIENQDQCLEKYSGIKIEFRDDGIEFLSKQITENSLYIICIDSYQCPWNEAYKKEHIVHFFLVAGRSGNNIICIDPQFLGDKKILTNISILNDIDSYSIVKFVESAEPSVDDLRNILISHYFKKKDHYIIQFETFIDTITRWENVDINRRIISNYFLRRLDHLSWSRYNFGRFLKYANETINNESLLELERVMSQISEKFKKVKNVLVKASLVPNGRALIDRVISIIKEIMKLEQLAIEKLKVYIDMERFKR